MKIRCIRAVLISGPLWLAVNAQFPAVCLAQEARFDAAVAAEVMRGTVAAQAAGAMRDNQQLLLDYQAVALEQELACEAAKRGLTERLDVQHALEQARRQVLVQALKKEVTRRVAPLDEADIKAAYEKEPTRWTSPAAFQIDAYPLDLSDSQDMDRARPLVTGKPVGDERLSGLTAKPVVLQSSGRWLTAHEVAPEVWTNLPAMKSGTARIFQTPAGAMLVRRGAFREPRIPPLEQVRGQIEIELEQQDAEVKWTEFLKKRRKLMGF